MQSQVSEKVRRKMLKMKVCVIGSPNSGKTFLIQHLTNSDQLLTPTEQYQVSMYSLSTKWAYMDIQLWDCSSQHSHFHKHLRQAFFRNCSAVLLVFNLGDKDWQQQAHNWISEAYQNHCYLVYAIANNFELGGRSGKGWMSGVEEPLVGERVEQLRAQAEAFFKKYQIHIHFMQSNENIRKSFELLFSTLHEESIIVSRKSIARGLQLPFDMEEALLEKDAQLGKESSGESRQ